MVIRLKDCDLLLFVFLRRRFLLQACIIKSASNKKKFSVVKHHHHRIRSTSENDERNERTEFSFALYSYASFLRLHFARCLRYSKNKRNDFGVHWKKGCFVLSAVLHLPHRHLFFFCFLLFFLLILNWVLSFWKWINCFLLLILVWISFYLSTFFIEIIHKLCKRKQVRPLFNFNFNWL